ncbi:MAG TPA: restriction endonuclease subunit S [Xanthomonadaceae bacterium]|nr:restriction endonuclease subunit S [Xanthomonadaceae bacterium]
MSTFEEIAVCDLFEAVGGRPKYVRNYIDRHQGPYPVYSASLTQPFGFVDEFEFEGPLLTWVMNGYGGRVQEIAGRFSANRDRGVLKPKSGIKTPDLTYIRYALEPQLTAAAVGRRVDGRLNEYTKLYPEQAGQVAIRLPVESSGKLDYKRMSAVGQKLRKIEKAQAKIIAAQDSLSRAVFSLSVPSPSETISVGDGRYFTLSIGDRVLRSQHASAGIAAYSANVMQPFGLIKKSNLSDFKRPSLLWGIDGNFEWNYIPAGEEFATTDHCGRLQVIDDHIDPQYVYWYLRSTRGQYGFDRVYRASLQNIKAEVVVALPKNRVTGKFCLHTQQQIAESLRNLEFARSITLSKLGEVLKARLALEAM